MAEKTLEDRQREWSEKSKRMTREINRKYLTARLLGTIERWVEERGADLARGQFNEGWNKGYARGQEDAAAGNDVRKTTQIAQSAQLKGDER